MYVGGYTSLYVYIYKTYRPIHVYILIAHKTGGGGHGDKSVG